MTSPTIAQAIDPAAFVVDAIHLLTAESRFSEENIAEFDREFDKRTEECRERMQDPKVRADLAARLVKLRTGQWP